MLKTRKQFTIQYQRRFLEYVVTGMVNEYGD